MTARLHLRDVTRPTHERTDAAFSALDLADRDDYGLFLSSHWLAYTALEPVFAATLPAAIRPPVMTTLLAADLRALGLDRPGIVPPDFDGDALGAAYVVAGSHFGKRVLSRRHGRSGDERVRAAGSYLASPALAAYWPVLQDGIERATVTPGRLEYLVEGADAAFALFAACLALTQARTQVQAPFQSGARLDRKASIPSRKSSLM